MKVELLWRYPMGLLERIDGIKTYIGMMAGGALGTIVALSPTINWDTPWVLAAISIIGAWTGISFKHSQDKKHKDNIAAKTTTSKGNEKK